MSNERKRLLYPDILRVAATVLVILNHLPSVDLHSYHAFPLSLFDGLLSFVIITDVPIFFMLTGMLLLDKEESISELFRKRILRIAAVLFVVFTGMYITNALVAVKHGFEADISWWGYLKAFFANGLDGTEFYWFLYAYLSLLFLLPFIRPAAKNMGRGEFLLLLAIRIFFENLVPVQNHIFDMGFNDTLGFTGDLFFPLSLFDAFFFSLCGYYLDRKVDIDSLKAKHFVLLYAGCVAGMLISGLYFLRPHWQMYSWLYTFTIFLTVKKLTMHRDMDGSVFAKCVRFIAPLTFGIYLLDPFFKRAFYAPYTDLFGDSYANILFSLGWLVLSFTLGTVITFVLKRIPLLKKFL